MLPPEPVLRSAAFPAPTDSAPPPTMHGVPTADALELRRCVVEAANASTALMLANARASAANAQLLSVAMPVDSLSSRCSSRAPSTARQRTRHAGGAPLRVGYEDWCAVIDYWLEQLVMLRDESAGSMLMRFMWISRSNVQVATTFGLLNDAYRGRRLHAFLESVVQGVNRQPGMRQRAVQIDCNMQKVHVDAHRRQGGARVSSQSMPVLTVTPSVHANGLAGSVEKTPESSALRYVWQELAIVAERMKADFSAPAVSRRRRQAMFGKPWAYQGADGAPGCDCASVASEASAFRDDLSAMSATPTLEEEEQRPHGYSRLHGHSEC